MPFRVSLGNPWTKTEAYLKRMQTQDMFSTLDRYAAMGVRALSAATPVDSGETAASWSYEIERRRGYCSIRWINSHEVAGRPLAVLLQYGHGTRQGGYVQGRDYINPAIRPIFDQIEAEVRRVVDS